MFISEPGKDFSYIAEKKHRTIPKTSPGQARNFGSFFSLAIPQTSPGNN